MRGRILDQTGGAAAFISVALTPTNSSEPTRSTRTDAFGDYRFTSLPPGNYTLSVELSGFRPFQQQLSVNSGATLTQDITLELTTQSTQVLVRADASAGLLRAETSLLEVPQSIQVIDEKVLDQQQVVRLENVFRNISGVNKFYAY